MNEQQPNEVHAASAEAVRSAIMVAMQAAELVAMRRGDQARAAQAASDQERAAYVARLAAEREAIKPVLRRAWDDQWWRRANAEQIKDVWQITASWAGADPYAAATLEEMRREARRRFGAELPGDPARADEVAALLAAHPAARREREPAAAATENEPASGETGEPHDDGEDELFAVPADRDEFGFVVRDAVDPSRVLDSGTIALEQGAGAADAAVEGLRRFARSSGPVPSPAEQVEALFAAGRGAGQARDVTGVEIAIYPAGQRDGQPLLVMPGARLAEAARERRAARRDVIDRRRPAAPAEIMAALRMETQATLDELRAIQEQQRHQAAAPYPDQAEQEMAVATLRQAETEARSRLSQLRLERRIAQAEERGEDGALIPRAELLREHLDEGWFQTAAPAEIAGMWDHVAAWPPGEARALAETHLRAGLYRAHRLDPDRDASGTQVAQALTRRGAALRTRARDERAAARTAGEIAAVLDAGDAGANRVRAERGRDATLRTDAAQDEAAAAALAASADREGAAAVALAAEGFTGTPSQRAGSAGHRAAGKAARRPAKDRQRIQDRGASPDR